jgi:hypothetical protein
VAHVEEADKPLPCRGHIAPGWKAGPSHDSAYEGAMAFQLRRAVPASRLAASTSVSEMIALASCSAASERTIREAEIVLDAVGRLGHRGLLETGNSRQLTAVRRATASYSKPPARCRAEHSAGARPHREGRLTKAARRLRPEEQPLFSHDTLRHLKMALQSRQCLGSECLQTGAPT